MSRPDSTYIHTYRYICSTTILCLIKINEKKKYSIPFYIVCNIHIRILAQIKQARFCEIKTNRKHKYGKISYRRLSIGFLLYLFFVCSKMHSYYGRLHINNVFLSWRNTALRLCQTSIFDFANVLQPGMDPHYIQSIHIHILMVGAYKVRIISSRFVQPPNTIILFVK